MERSHLLEHLADRISQIRTPHPVCVGIDGVDAAGKTTLADELVQPLTSRDRSVIRASIDGFHNPASVRHRRGPGSPEGYYRDSFDYLQLRAVLLDPLGPGGSLQYRTAVFDYRKGRAVNVQSEQASADAILLFDGVFLMCADLRRCWDFVVFVEVDFDVVMTRAIQRDVSLFGSSAGVRQRYAERYLPEQRLYLRECRPRERASLVVRNNDPSNPDIVGRAPLRAEQESAP